MAETEARQELLGQIDHPGETQSQTSSNNRHRLERNYFVARETKMLLLKEQLSNIQQLNFESLEKLNTLLGESHMMHTNDELRALRQHAQEIKSKISMIVNAKEDGDSTKSGHMH